MATTSPPVNVPVIDDSVMMKKITRRLIPFLFLLYVIAYIDRVNVGFAKLQMTELPWFTEAVFAFGSGIFFIGYFLFEVPSNLILQRVGARRWIARIMFTWGILAMGMMFLNSANTFYTMRFLLGIAEAGFFPGVILYLTYWYTPQERARVVALFMTANCVSYTVGGPLSSALIQLNGISKLAGWQWLFLLEGLPAVLLGFVVLAYLPDGPKQARWLSDVERERITERLAASSTTSHTEHLPLWKALSNPLIALFALVYFTMAFSMYGIGFWLPTVLKNFGNLSTVATGMLTAIPYGIAGFVMVAAATHSDRTNERRFHLLGAAAVGAFGLSLCAISTNATMSLIALTIAASGLWSTLGPFWAQPTSVLSKTAAAGGIALINSVGNLGGFVGPYLFGFIKNLTHSERSGLYMLAGTILLGGFLGLLIPRRR